MDRVEEIRQRFEQWPFAKDEHPRSHWEVDAYAEDIPYLLALVEKLREQNKELLADNQRMHGKLSSLAAERQSHAFWATF